LKEVLKEVDKIDGREYRYIQSCSFTTKGGENNGL
jgi:hypothetical protein